MTNPVVISMGMMALALAIYLPVHQWYVTGRAYVDPRVEAGIALAGIVVSVAVAVAVLVLSGAWGSDTR